MAESRLEILGRYKILDVIGRGAMGVVYKAVDPAIDRVVAIKTINLSLSKDELEEYEARFQQEIKAAGRLNHPNIVTIYDVGRTDQLAYMAMEFIDGKELKEILAAGKHPKVDVTVDLIAQVADGIAFAHQHDVIHRDIKPSNIMVVKLPNSVLAKVTDFGIARTSASAVKTMTGLILGSPRYMSPEQVIGKTLDFRSDIFSLGVVLYETLTGVAPFDGDNVNAIMYATINVCPVPPSMLNPAVPTMLDLIVAKALAKKVDDRYQKMRDFARDLREVRRLMVNAASDVQASRTSASAKTASSPVAGQLQQQPDDAPAQPFQFAKQFDSFDATMRLAKLTSQADEFREYISETQKMRAYQGIDTGSAPDAGAGAAAPAKAGKSRASKGTWWVQTVRLGASEMQSDESAFVSKIILGTLVFLALGLLFALLLR